jgi:hypothetical protein
MKISEIKVSEQDLQEYLDSGYKARGTIITHTVNLERNIDLFICRYFCNNDDVKALELMELLVSERIEFSQKSASFIEILKKQCKRDNIDFNKKYPRIATDFIEIAKDRNYFAHKMTVTPLPDDIGKNVIVLKGFKNESKILPYTQDEIDKILDKINTYSNMVYKLNNPT